jgi:hypothetical protein
MKESSIHVLFEGNFLCFKHLYVIDDCLSYHFAFHSKLSKFFHVKRLLPFAKFPC